MEINKIVIIIAIVLIIAIILSIVKNIAKLIILILTVAFIFVIIRTVALGQNPLDIFKDTKTATTYTKQIYDYSGKINDSVNSTIKAMENNSLPELKNENSKLHEYLQQVSKLQHITELNKFHNQYTKYLSDIVSVSDTAVNGTNLKDGAVKNIDVLKTRLNKYINELTQLRLN